MRVSRRVVLGGMAGSLVMPKFGVAQANKTIRIGIVQDASGPYHHIGGAVSVTCAKQAASEIASGLGLNVEFLTGDHRNKPDIGLGIVRQWLDEGVDAVMEFTNSAIALGASDLIRERDKVMLATAVASSALTGPKCSPNNTHWTFDTEMLARTVGAAILKTGAKKWFFLRADYAFGQDLRNIASALVEKEGGQVVGEVPIPLGTTDFASALVQAQASKADVVALAIAGADLQNCIKQAGEFGLAASGQKLAALATYINDVHALGLTVAQGTNVTESFYWDLNDRTRAFTNRVIKETGGIPPNMVQAGAYSSVRHYLKAVASIGVDQAKASGRAAVEAMKALPVEDDILTNASVREDGRVVSDVHLFEVKAPSASTSEWDLYALKATLSPEEAWRPLNEGGCPLIRT